MDKELWFSIRGTEMILNMKIVSLVFDLDNENKLTSNDFDLLNYLNYLSSFCTVIFGPWISFHDYLNCLSSRNKSV
jgi:porcupine-like protein